MQGRLNSSRWSFLRPTSARKWGGLAACLLALLMASGGHWYALQGLAWISMFSEFAQHDSLRAAAVKTFSGQHPCRLCLQIRHDRQTEEQQGTRRPWLKPEKIPEFIRPAEAARETPLEFFMDPIVSPPAPSGSFQEPPPKPPPRCLAAV